MAGRSGPSSGFYHPSIPRAPKIPKVVSRVCACEWTRPFPSTYLRVQEISIIDAYIQILSLLGRNRCWPRGTGPYGYPSYLTTPFTFCSSGVREFSARDTGRDTGRHSDTSSQRLLEGRQQIKIHTMVSHNQGTGDHNHRIVRSCGGYRGCGSRYNPEQEK